MSSPSGFDSWFESLSLETGELSFDKTLANQLRLIAGLKDYGVLMTSGLHALPYSCWLRDGMSMNSRLLIHQMPEARSLSSWVESQQVQDIRVASHFQAQDAFTNDIREHRFDLMVLAFLDGEGDADQREMLASWLALLRDGGLAVLLASARLRSEFESLYTEEYFSAEFGESETCLMLVRKGSQHRAVRRGARRRAR